MCMKRSQRHGTLQGTLIFLLVLVFILLVGLILFCLITYHLTEPATLRQQRHAAFAWSHDEPMLSSQSSHSYTLNQVRRRRDVEDQPLSEKLSDWLFARNCSINQWIVQSAMLLDLCEAQNPLESINNVQFTNCLRESYLYIGLAACLPLCLVLLSLISVCRLWLCPIITLAIVYLGLALALTLAAILYKSGVILTEGWPLFVLIIGLVCLYALLSLLLILLFALVTCEKRHSNGDSDKMIKMNDDDDEIDDPNVPLYKNGVYSPQKRTDFDDKIKDFKYIDDDMSYVFRRG